MPRVQVSRRSGSTYVLPRHLIRRKDGEDDGDSDDGGGSDGGDDSGDESGDDENKGKKNKKNGKGRGKNGKQEGQTAPPQPSPPAPAIGSIPPPSQGIPAPGASQGASQGLPAPKEAYVPPSPPLVSAAAATPAGGGEAAQTSADDSAPPSTTTSTSKSEEPAASSAAGSPAGVAVNVEPSPTPSSSTDPASSATSTEAASATAASTADASSPPPSGTGATPTVSDSKAVETCSTAANSSGGYGKRDKGHGGSNNNSEKGGNDDKPCSTSSLDVSASQGQSSQSPQPGLPGATSTPSKHNLVIVGVASALVSFTIVSAIIWGLWFLVRRRRKERRAYEAAQDAARFAIVDPAALPASMYAGRSSPSAVYLPEGRTTPGSGLNVIYGRVTPNSFDSGSVPQFITAQEADALHARKAAANPNPFVSSDDRDSTYVNPFAQPHDRKLTSDSHDAESMYTMSV